MRTYTPKPGEVTRAWHVIDATDVVLGRLASQTAVLLRGKHKPTFAPHVDTGDFVIIINADKVALTGAKADAEARLPPLRVPGRSVVADLRRAARQGPPRRPSRRPCAACSPRTPSARQQLSKLKVYSGAHPHAAQKPKPFEITQVAQ
jgi:large subunit ribosomal protein L13